MQTHHPLEVNTVHKKSRVRQTPRRLTTALVLSLALATVLAGPAFAAKRPSGSGGGGGSTTTGSGSLTLVMVTDANGNGAPNWGDTITWRISTTATSTPYVGISCNQNGVNVYNASAGFFASYPWPWAVNMTLKSSVWSGGAADCMATLYYPSGTKTVTITTVAFPAGA